MVYNIMIADDEQVIRSGLKNFIDWEAMECKIVCEAKTGLEALEFLQNIDVNIVIADIKMPGLNGIELAEHIYKNYPHVKTILLTGFADFSYAQSAIKYGVIDFITKANPIDKIKEAVIKAKDIILKQKQDELTLRKLQDKVIESLDEVRKKFIQDLINRIVINPEFILNRAEELDIFINNYFVLLFRIVQTPNRQGCATEEEQNQFLSSVNSFLSMAFKDYKPYTFCLKQDLLLTIISFDNDDYSLCIQDINTLCEEILSMTDSFMNFSLMIGISGIHKVIPNINSAFYEAQNALEFTNNFNCRVAYFIKERKVNNIESTSINKYKEDLMRSIQSGNYEDALTIISIIKEAENGIQIAGNINNNEYLIEKARQYIEKNYNKSINLQTIAEHVHLNSSYLSRYFKQKTGENITEAINKMRVQKAKALILSNKCKTYEIANMVGYSDSAYFSNIFKRNTGLTPKEFRAANLK